ncbi:hypothetical protein PanWU01x14_195640 [Parasponia andersonii]|uniref:Uncharacterized protein n=1 Tax=Parasponia andersonii TaxID=3476 RepID=A0A2P5C010_PARAD|nr:hypothetical protein PanWU01x14_195640 [Parasponia andersonii]
MTPTQDILVTSAPRYSGPRVRKKSKETDRDEEEGTPGCGDPHGMTSRKLLMRRTMTWRDVMIGVDSVGDILGGVHGLRTKFRQ